jgi:hypothetical protein
MDIIKESVWLIGPQVLAEKDRPMIGKWLKTFPPEALLEAIITTHKARAADPLTYVQGCLKNAPKAVEELKLTGQWERRVKLWEDKQFWLLMWGPKPGEDGCTCPPEYLSEMKG